LSSVGGHLVELDTRRRIRCKLDGIRFCMIGKDESSLDGERNLSAQNKSAEGEPRRSVGTKLKEVELVPSQECPAVGYWKHFISHPVSAAALPSWDKGPHMFRGFKRRVGYSAPNERSTPNITWPKAWPQDRYVQTLWQYMMVEAGEESSSVGRGSWASDRLVHFCSLCLNSFQYVFHS